MATLKLEDQVIILERGLKKRAQPPNLILLAHLNSHCSRIDLEVEVVVQQPTFFAANVLKAVSPSATARDWSSAVEFTSQIVNSRTPNRKFYAKTIHCHIQQFIATASVIAAVQSEEFREIFCPQDDDATEYWTERFDFEYQRLRCLPIIEVLENHLEFLGSVKITRLSNFCQKILGSTDVNHSLADLEKQCGIEMPDFRPTQVNKSSTNMAIKEMAAPIDDLRSFQLNEVLHQKEITPVLAFAILPGGDVFLESLKATIPDASVIQGLITLFSSNSNFLYKIGNYDRVAMQEIVNRTRRDWRGLGFLHLNFSTRYPKLIDTITKALNLANDSTLIRFENTLAMISEDDIYESQQQFLQL